MGARRADRFYKLSVLAEQAVPPEKNSSGQQANDERHEQHLPVRDFRRLGNGPHLGSRHRNVWREHGLERFVIQVSVVHRHFAGMIELGVVDDDLRLQFRSQSRPRMKHGRLVHGAIIRRSNVERHFIGTAILATVELDLGFECLAH
jgi:hypothetical protein